MMSWTAVAAMTCCSGTAATTGSSAGPATITCSAAPVMTCWKAATETTCSTAVPAMIGLSAAPGMTGSSSRRRHSKRPISPGKPRAADQTMPLSRTSCAARTASTSPSFSALTGGDDHGARDDRGDPVRLVSEGHDSVLIFAGGSARIEGVTHLDASDFIFGDNSAAPVANGNPFGEADPTARLVQAMATFSPSGLSSSGEILANTSGPFPPPDQLAPSPQNGSGYHSV